MWGRGENASLPQQNQRESTKLPKTSVYAQTPCNRCRYAAEVPHDMKHRVFFACLSRVREPYAGGTRGGIMRSCRGN